MNNKNEVLCGIYKRCNSVKNEEPYMSIQRYSANLHPNQILLTWINSCKIAIHENWSPFVWSLRKVRDLKDLLYVRYTICYLIARRNSTLSTSVPSEVKILLKSINS